MKKIVALGDSITWGYPYGEKYSWVHFLEQKMKNHTWINKGVNGDTFRDMLSRLKKDVLVHNPDICIVMGGFNDIINGISFIEIERNFMKICENLSQKKIQIVIGIPFEVDLMPEINQKILSFQKFLEETVKNQNWISIDFRILDAKHYFDGIHPNKSGYIKMGQQAYTVLEKIL